MEVKVITRHAISNYGSLLQSIATQRIIERLGHDCKIIDYIPDAERGINALLGELKNKSSWNKNFVKKGLYLLLRYPFAKYSERRFLAMRNNILKMTERVANNNQLASLQADAFVTGSDQVWGPAAGLKYDPAYFLSFVGNSAKKFAFSASFGRTKFDNDIKSEYKKLLFEYDKLAVREDSAVELIESMGIPVKQVLDPTLLIDRYEWLRMVTKERKGEYLLVYELHSNKELDIYAKRFAKHIGLPLLRVSPSFHQFSRGGKFLWMKDVGEFLGLVKNAKYMITDSFHGTAFAINFNTPFIEILHGLTGTRSQSILKLTGLENRILMDYDDFSLKGSLIDWNSVNAIIEHERERSIDILRDMLR